MEEDKEPDGQSVASQRAEDLDFADVLRTVARSPGPAPTIRRPTTPGSLWPAVESPPGSPLAGQRSFADEAYRQEAEEADELHDEQHRLDADEAMFEPPSGAESEDVARELGPLGALSLAELARLRRSFAAANHPDNAEPRLRPRANTRMSLANALIDAAVATRTR